MTHLRAPLFAWCLTAACGPAALDDADPAGDPGPGPAGDSDGDASGDVDGGGDPVACAPQYASPVATPQPPALIVTNAALSSVFGRLAELHTVLGVPTAVVTVESICAARACNDGDAAADTAKAIKDYLASVPGLDYVMLGGDIEVVPSRMVYDSYSNPFDSSYTYASYFYTDAYFADFSAWDANGDGVYAEDGVDSPDLIPELALSRIPVSTVVEAERYLAKVSRYLGAYAPGRVATAMLVSDIAATYSYIDIDAAWYFEADGKTSSLLPDGFAVRKLYATLAPDMTAETATINGLTAAIAEGYNLIVHSGHGSEETLFYATDGQLTGSAAYALQNTTLPIVLSCACLAGDFGWDDSAGEQLINAPGGGAVAYLGNTVIGLGIAGGMQLIDELLFYIQTHELPLLGDALRAAHETMPASDTFEVPVVHFDVPVVDQASYEWTQKAVVLFGDVLLPVWKAARQPAPLITANAEPLCAGTRVTFELTPAAAGVLRFLAGGSLYEVQVNGASASVVIPEEPERVTAGFRGDATFWRWAELGL